MSHDVFISFAFRDEQAATKVCHYLRNGGVDCFWCKDLAPGARYVHELGKAIRESKALLVVLSSAADNSDSLVNEVTIAHNNRIPRIPVRIENVLPVNLEYVLANSLFFDAFPPPLEQYLPRLLDAIRRHLGQQDQDDRPAQRSQRAPDEAGSAPAFGWITDSRWRDVDLKDLSQWVFKRKRELDSGREISGRTFIYRRNRHTGKYQRRLKPQS
jgi:hypothetical protein